MWRSRHVKTLKCHQDWKIAKIKYNYLASYNYGLTTSIPLAKKKKTSTSIALATVTKENNRKRERIEYVTIPDRDFENYSPFKYCNFFFFVVVKYSILCWAPKFRILAEVSFFCTIFFPVIVRTKPSSCVVDTSHICPQLPGRPQLFSHWHAAMARFSLG